MHCINTDSLERKTPYSIYLEVFTITVSIYWNIAITCCHQRWMIMYQSMFKCEWILGYVMNFWVDFNASLKKIIIWCKFITNEILQSSQFKVPTTAKRPYHLSQVFKIYCRLKFVMVVAETNLQQIFWIPTDYTRYLFKTFTLTVGVKPFLSHSKVAPINWI